MELPRISKRKNVLAILVIASAAALTAACGQSPTGGSPSAKATTDWSSSGTSKGGSAATGPGIGFYDGKFGPSGIETAATWLGSPSSIKYAADFMDATDWSHISTPWQLSNWKGNPYTMVWGIPMLPCGGSSTQCATKVSDYDQVASGGADGYFKTLAKNLVADGFGSSYIRLGWEFNGSEMGWAICNGQGTALASWAGDFVPAFRNIVTSMRSVSGADFKFIWNPLVSSNVGCAGNNFEKFYPGDSYVDSVGLDVYDGLGQSTSDAARWTDLLDGVNGGRWTPAKPTAINGQQFKGYGLDWTAAFAKEHNKPVSIPEWGLDSTSTNAGGGDDAYFMTHMTSWIKANVTGPAIFWNFGEGNLPLNIPNYTSAATPDATAAFKSAFSTGA
jgi:hypothetical protein